MRLGLETIGLLHATLSSLFLFWAMALNWQLTNARNVPHEAGGQQKVWAQEGGRAVLPCHLSPQEVESRSTHLYKGLSLRWVQHGGSSNKERHLVLEVEPSGLKKHARAMMYRASVWDTGFLHGNFSLQIEPLLKEDAGTYEALVKFGKGILHCQMELGVVSVTANPPGPLVETEPVKLTCNSTHPDTPTKISWLHTGHFVPTSTLDQSLVIVRASRSDSGPWVCQLTFAGGETVSATHSLQVLGFAEPTFPVVYTAAGSDAHLPCALNYNPTDYDIPEVAVHWSFMAREGPEAKPTQRHGNKQNFALHMPAVRPNDAGRYRCEITIRGTTLMQNITLAVITVSPSIKGPVTEGSHLGLTCTLSYPTGKEHFQWKQLGLVPTSGPRSGAASTSPEVLSWGRTREFAQVSPNDAGTWECSVYGPDGMLGSVEYHLEIAASSLHVASLPPTKAGKITFGLMIFLFVLVVFIMALTLLRRRMHPPDFPALDRIVAASLPGKGAKGGGQEEKDLQTEY